MTAGWATRSVVGVGAVVALTTSGCWWAQPGAGPGNTYHNGSESSLTLANVATLEHAWSAPGSVSAVVDGKVVGVSDIPVVEVVARDVATGDELWSRALTPPGSVGGPTHPPVVAAGHVWAGYQAERLDGECAFGLARLDLDSGTPVADDTTGAPSEIVPFGHQVALQTSTYLPMPVGGGCWPEVPPGFRVVEGATAAPSWSATWSAGQIVVTGDRLFAVGGMLRSYVALGCGAATCAPAWSVSPGGLGGLSDLAGEAAGPLVATAATANPGETLVVAIDQVTGAVTGSATVPFTAYSLALADGTAYIAGESTVGGGESTVVAFDAASCAGTCVPLWMATLGGRAAAPDGLAVGGDVLYVGREDGAVEAYPADGCAAATCAPVVEVATPGPVRSLAIASGRLFVGSESSVTAFAPGG